MYGINNIYPSRVWSEERFTNEELNGLVRRFWEQEVKTPSLTSLSDADRECEEHFFGTHARTADDRYAFLWLRPCWIYPTPVDSPSAYCSR